MRAKSLILFGILTYLFLSLVPSPIYSIIIPDFRVNTDSALGIAQYDPDIAFDSSGNFAVVYTDRGYNHDNRQIYFQRFDSHANRLGGLILVSDTTIHLNDTPKIAMSPSGSFVITWGSQTGGSVSTADIWVRRYDSSGNPLGLYQKVDVDQPDPDTLDCPQAPDVALDHQGNFIVVWATQKTGVGRYALAQRFSSSGERIGNNFNVSDLSASDYPICRFLVQWPKVVYNSKGYFLVCWDSCVRCKNWGPQIAIARIYNPSGEPITKIFPLMDPCGTRWWYSGAPAVAATPQNNFVATYYFNDTLNTYPHNAIMVQVFDTLGTPLDTGRVVNDVLDLGNYDFQQYISADSTGGYVVIWADMRTLTDRNLWAQRFDSFGRPQGSNYRINTPPGALRYGGEMYDLAIHGNTVGFAWADSRNLKLYYVDIYAKLLDLDKLGFYNRGDVNLDEGVSVADIIYLINYLFRNGWVIIPEWTGDTNSDGKITVSDVVYLVNYLFKGGPSP